MQIACLFALLLVVYEGSNAVYKGDYLRIFGCLFIGTILAFGAGGLFIWDFLPLGTVMGAVDIICRLESNMERLQDIVKGRGRNEDTRDRSCNQKRRMGIVG